MKWAYAERTNLDDPSFTPSITTYEADMLSDTTVESIRAKTSDTETFGISYYDPLGIESLPTHGTSHMVATDKSELAISLTTTIGTFFGSQVMVPETGIIMNNIMNDFSIPRAVNAFGHVPSPANYIRPNKRPLSSISATIIEYPNGTLHYLIGASGASHIITSTIQNMWHVLDRGLSLPSALAQPRMHNQLISAKVTFERSGLSITGYDNSTVAYLKGLGANVTWVAPGLSNAQGIIMSGDGTFVAAGEPRQAASGGFVF